MNKDGIYYLDRKTLLIHPIELISDYIEQNKDKYIRVFEGNCNTMFTASFKLKNSDKKIKLSFTRELIDLHDGYDLLIANLLSEHNLTLDEVYLEYLTLPLNLFEALAYGTDSFYMKRRHLANDN